MLQSLWRQFNFLSSSAHSVQEQAEDRMYTMYPLIAVPEWLPLSLLLLLGLRFCTNHCQPTFEHMGKKSSSLGFYRCLALLELQRSSQQLAATYICMPFQSLNICKWICKHLEPMLNSSEILRAAKMYQCICFVITCCSLGSLPSSFPADCALSQFRFKGSVGWNEQMYSPKKIWWHRQRTQLHPVFSLSVCMCCARAPTFKQTYLLNERRSYPAKKGSRKVIPTDVTCRCCLTIR